MDSAAQNRYLGVRARLAELNYSGSFGADAVDLVEKLVDDIVSTTGAYKQIQVAVESSTRPCLAVVALTRVHLLFFASLPFLCPLPGTRSTVIFRLDPGARAVVPVAQREHAAGS